MLMDDIIDKVTYLLREASKLEVMPRFRNLHADEIKSKSSPKDLVTEADIRAEAWLIPHLQDLVPGSLVIGEECVAASPSLLSQLDDKGVFWIVDPVDGTGNFVKGLERFAMMVALVERGTISHSWIYSPTSDEIAVAQRGAGASWAGKVLTQSPVHHFADASAEYSENYMPPDLRQRLRDNMRKLTAYNNGRSSAWAYLDCARGKIDMVLAGRMKPWDHAAGVLLVREVGGRSGMLRDGSSYQPKPYIEPPMLTVANKAMWEPFQQALVINEERRG